MNSTAVKMNKTQNIEVIGIIESIKDMLWTWYFTGKGFTFNNLKVLEKKLDDIKNKIRKSSKSSKIIVNNP